MFFHHGNERTFKHNLQIASLLSFVAGTVNVIGFLTIGKLTTNVTGHFAFFVEEVLQYRFWPAAVLFIYILSFFLGSVVSGLLIEFVYRKNERLIFIIPAILETILLAVLGFSGAAIAGSLPDVLACGLLFSMGLQNSFVTRISGAIVRTTHLTGLFTDLGIEISQLFFFSGEQRSKLLSFIKLRLTIISCFFIGGLLAGFVHRSIGVSALLLSASILAFGLLIDAIRLQKKINHQKKTGR